MVGCAVVVDRASLSPRVLFVCVHRAGEEIWRWNKDGVYWERDVSN